MARKTKEDALVTRNHILDTAVEVFGHQGVAQTSLNDIAREAGVTRGAIFDVAVDLRPGSPTFRRWTGTELTAENGRALLIGKGMAHGFVTLQPHAIGYAAGGCGGAQPGAHRRAFCAGAAAGCGGG